MPKESMNELVKQPTLVVDLDSTLIRTDMLFETLWSATSKDWRNIFFALSAALQGRANLKAELAEYSSVDVELLPYNRTVLKIVSEWKDRGGKTVLATGTNESVAKRIAAHLGIFDAVYGSTSDVNLTGRTKAELLRREFPKGFTYVGDSSADLHIWRVADAVITIDVSSAVRSRIEKAGKDAQHYVTKEISQIHALAKAVRPIQWLKNMLIFVPLFLSQEVNIQSYVLALIGFVSFCFVASSVYLLNDLLDLDSDRRHSKKRNRPLAAGTLSIKIGSMLAIVIFSLGLIISLFLGWKFFSIVVFYFISTLVYSLFLKSRMVIDICLLSVLYTTRIVAGGLSAEVDLSVWLLAFSIFLFFSLAAIKRQAELKGKSSSSKSNLPGRNYVVEDLQVISQMAVSSGFISILVMALYLNSDRVRVAYSSPEILWGICIVLLYWVSRIVMITHRGQMNEDPVFFAARDRVSWVCAVLCAGFLFLAD